MLYICSAQSRNLHNLEIAHWVYAISRLRGISAQDRSTRAQSRDSAISVACTIEPFEFPSYIKVRYVCNKLLQLCCYLQCRACILKPPHQGLPGSSPTRRNSLPLGLGMGAERSQTCGVPRFKASPSLKVLKSLLLVSSDALTRLAHYGSQIAFALSRNCANVLRNSEIAQTYCAQSQDCANS